MDWHMKKIHQICLSTLLTLTLATLAHAGMYKWVDKDGHTHYSQQPPSDANYERLNIRTQSPSGSSSNQSSGPTYSNPTGSSDGPASNVIKQQEAKGEELRQKNCEQAKKQLEVYTVYRRVRKKDGSVVYLDDKERAKRIEDAKAAIKEFCQ